MSSEARDAALSARLTADPETFGVIIMGFLMLMAVGLALNFYFLVARRGRGPWFASALPQQPPRWGTREVIQAFLFFFVAEVLIFSTEQLAALFFSLKSAGKDAMLITNSLLRDICVAAFVIAVAKVRYRHPLSDLGLTARGLLRNVYRGLVAYAAIVPLLVIVMAGLAALMARVGYEPPPQTVVQIFLDHSREDHLFALTFFVALLGPIIEEIFFRGFAYRALRFRWGAPKAAFITAVFFAVLHMNAVAFLPIFLLGLYLAYLYERTGSLVPSMTVHAVHNLAMVLLTLAYKAFSS